MHLTAPEHGPVLYVTCNMRASDKEEIYGLRFEDNPYLLMNDVMAQSRYAWVAWHDGKPAAVFGGAQSHPGVWRMFAFGTDDFIRIARPLTRFATKTVIPQLFGELGAHRLECDSHEKHATAHRWLDRLGARVESIRKGYGRDGADYLHYVLTRYGAVIVMEKLTDPEQREALTWALCAESGGSGIDKCEPQYCACGPEALGVIAALHNAGFEIVRTSRSDTPCPT